MSRVWPYARIIIGRVPTRLVGAPPKRLEDPRLLRGQNIVPLGHAERAFAGMPHDGMRVLSDLVEWTTG